jgi:adenosine deaminase
MKDRLLPLRISGTRAIPSGTRYPPEKRVKQGQSHIVTAFTVQRHSLTSSGSRLLANDMARCLNDSPLVEMIHSAELTRRIEAMPKVELHVHLEGAADAETIYELAERNRTALPVRSLAEWKQFYQFTSFDHFIDVYAAASHCVQSSEDFALLTERFLAHQARQNIRYSEVFVSVSHHLGKMSGGELLDALAAGMASGEKKHGCRARIIADITRHQPETQREVLKFALQEKARGLVIGLGLGGKEIGYPPQQFEETYTAARRKGLRVVAHAGETSGSSSVRGAMECLRAERIGHGVRCLEDAALCEQLRVAQTPLEVCPVSNYCLGVVARGDPHPIRQMVDAGLYCTVNSDDPPMFSTDLNHEYWMLAKQGFTWDELWQLNLNSLEAAFLSEDEKARYRCEWQKFALAVSDQQSELDCL